MLTLVLNLELDIYIKQKDNDLHLKVIQKPMFIHGKTPVLSVNQSLRWFYYDEYTSTYDYILNMTYSES